MMQQKFNTRRRRRIGMAIASAAVSMQGTPCIARARKTNLRLRRSAVLKAVSAAALPLGLLLHAPSSLQAADVYWNVPSGDWSVPTDWSTHALPGSGDTARIESSLAEVVSLGSNQTIYALSIASSNSAVRNVLNQTAGNLSSDDESVGGTGGGIGYHNQSGGMNTLASYLIPGQFANTIGEYDVSNNAILNLTGTGSNGIGLYVGDQGNGVFNQSGGTVNVGSSKTSNLYLAYSPGALGIASLTGGNFNVSGNAYIGGNDGGAGGIGTLSVSGSATATVNGSLTLYNTSRSAVNLTGGTLNVGSFNTSGNPSNFYWTGGTFNISGAAGLRIDGAALTPIGAAFSPFGSSLTLSATQQLIVSGGSLTVGDSLGNGTFTLNGPGSLYVSGGGEFVGYGGTGLFNQSAGTNTTANLYLSDPSGSSGSGTYSGTYLLSGTGVLNASVVIVNDGTSTNNNTFNQSGGTSTSIQLHIGDGGTGTYLQSGGTANTGTLLVGYGGTGTYTLNGTGTLNASGGIEIVGYGGTGLFNQSAGTNTTATLEIGETYGQPGSGTYLLSGTGVLNAGSVYINNGTSGNNNTFNQSGGTCTSTELTIGYSGPGTYLQSGGTANTGTLLVGYGGTGTYTLNGTGTLNGGSGIEVVGFGGTGLFNQSAGTNTTGTLEVGETSGQPGSGTYLLSGTGVLNASSVIVNNDTSSTNNTFNQSGGTCTSTELTIGYSGPGTYLQSGGTATTGTLLVGYGGTGTYTLNGTGTLNGGGGIEIVGYGGTGLFNQSAGTNTTGTLEVGETSGQPGSGTYLLSGTGMLNISGSIYVGVSRNCTGTFNQSGGTSNSTTLFVSDDAGSSGTYLQSGGTVNTGELYLGEGQGVGTYILNGPGTLNVSTGNALELIGLQGPGVFNQSAGTNIAGGMFLTDGTNSSGTYLLSGTGVLNVLTGIVVGYASPSTAGVFNQSGGTSTIFGEILVANANGNAVYLSGGKLSVGFMNLSGNSTLFHWTGGTLQLTGGNSSFGSLAVPKTGTLTGNGIVTGSVTSDGIVAPLSSASATLNISSGNYTQNTDGTLAIRLAGTTQGTQYDYLQGTGSASLAGSLTFTQNYQPAAGDTFQVLNFAGGISGTFSTIQQLPGFIWTPTYNDTAGTLTLSLSAVNNTVNDTTTSTLSGSWTNPALWSGGIYPNNNPATGTVFNPTINGAGQGATVITLSSAVSVGNVNINNATVVIPTGGGLSGNTIAVGIGDNGTDTANVTTTGSGNVDATAVDLYGSSSFAQTGSSTVTLTTALYDAGNGSIYTLPAGNTLNAAVEYVGPSYGTTAAYGAFNQTGGTNNVGQLYVANQAVGSGVYNISGGNLNASVNIVIGSAGVINQSGGIVSVINGTGPLICGNYILSNGDLQTGQESLNSVPTSSFLQTGGTQENSSYVAIDGGAGTVATYNISGGSATINSLDVGVNPFYLTTPSGGTANFMLGSAGSLTVDFSVNNYGTITLAGNQTYAPGVIFQNNTGASATFASDAGANGANLTINQSGGSVLFTSTQHLANLIIGAGTVTTMTGGANGNRSLLVTPALSIAGTLDLTTSYLDLQNSASLATITELVAQGYNNGHWTGPGIISSTAAANTQHLTTLGVIQNNQSGTALFTNSNFDGTTPGAGDILVKYTYYGDANLDGKVDASDYSLIDSGFITHATGWFNGDFNYDGLINGSDYTLIDNAFNTQGAQLTAELATTSAQVANSSSVPEPATAALSAIAATALLRRRMPRHNRRSADATATQ